MANSEATAVAESASDERRRVRRRIAWLGQTLASVCWIGSVFAYGLSAPGDWLQLFAASAWLVANLADAASADAG
ncbi:MAG: hypothetical protein B7733_04250 [Myxococcales bacterium FL481]|nr:MAG: hypothetical protein B7733_04250 [Myxococcales bacterium FL481]